MYIKDSFRQRIKKTKDEKMRKKRRRKPRYEKMKKTVVAVFIFLFIATAMIYAGIFRDQANDTNNNSSGIAGSNYGNTHDSEREADENYGGFFGDPLRGPSGNDPDPGGRPGSGGAIGQEEAHLGDGLSVLIACCAVLVIVKTVNKKRKED